MVARSIAGNGAKRMRFCAALNKHLLAFFKYYPSLNTNRMVNRRAKSYALAVVRAASAELFCGAQLPSEVWQLRKGEGDTEIIHRVYDPAKTSIMPLTLL